MKRTAERETFLADVVTIGMDSGATDYWSTCLCYRWHCTCLGASDKANPLGLAPNNGSNAYAEITEDETDKLFIITLNVIAHGIGKILRQEVSIRDDYRKTIQQCSQENDASEIDSDLADCIIQAGIFEKIIYG